MTFREYAERWRLSREAGWAVETRRRVESNLRNQLYPVYGGRPIRAVTLTAVLEWLSQRLAEETPKTSMKLYFELLDAVFAAAVTDKVIAENPCTGVNLAKILRGISRAPKWVPTEDEVAEAVRRHPVPVPRGGLARRRAGVSPGRSPRHGRGREVRRRQVG